MSIVKLDDAEHAKRARIHTTLVVRLKPNRVVKARSRLIGDRVAGTVMPYTNAPTVGRSLVRILVAHSSIWGYPIVMCDISQSFLQSATSLESGNFIAIPPACISSDLEVWGGTILTTTPKCTGGGGYGLLRNTPLYGSSHAPLRWCRTIAAMLRRYGYFPHRTDICFSVDVGQNLRLLPA